MKWFTVPLAAAITLAPSAKAEDPDQLFLSYLFAAGISVNNAPDTITYGHLICAAMSRYSFPDVVEQVNDGTKIGTQLADQFTVAAVMSYCPNYMGKILNARISIPAPPKLINE